MTPLLIIAALCVLSVLHDPFVFVCESDAEIALATVACPDGCGRLAIHKESYDEDGTITPCGHVQRMRRSAARQL